MDTKNLSVNPIVVQNLYEMRTYTDQQAGTIFRQIPILEDGSRDPMRQETFGASCTLLVRGQPMPITFQIDGATSLADAITKFPDAVRAAVQQMRDQALRSQLAAPGAPAAKSIIDLSKTRN